ncbi:MAG: PaaI family thioesterase [Lachnospiraceae bacterium]|jgi:acyl-CoA thioesterase|nr:PaaI family thioesterase [Lachnospiraceae bacterium]
MDFIKDFFENDKYLKLTGVVMESVDPEADSCRLSLKVGPEHINAGHKVQGGAIYTLADSAFAVASNARHLAQGEKRLTVNQSASISYTCAGEPGSTLYADASKISGGKRASVYRIDVTDDRGRLVATMVGNGITVDFGG